jgi:hypothetical protein
MYARSRCLALVLACAAASPGYCADAPDAAAIEQATSCMAGGHKSDCASVTDFPPAIQRALTCMANVLRTVPGVTMPTSGVLPRTELGNPRRGPAPFVRYTWQGEGAVTFVAGGNDYSDRAKFFFTTVLGGLSQVGQMPHDWGTGPITKLWKAQCGVWAGAIYL